jgi:hypothetical protein
LSGFVAGLSLPALPFTVPSSYFLIRNGIWGAWGLVAALGAFFGMRWAPRLVRWGGAAALVWFWADRLFLTGSDYARSSLPVLAVVSVLSIGATLFVLSRHSVRRYFGEMN